jgi:hypothetical protein
VPDSLLAEPLGVSEKTLSRARAGKGRLDPVTSDRLFRVARIVTLAIEVLASEAAALHWLKRPQIGLGGKVPLSLLAIPWAARTPLVLAVAFVLLRIFDIGKPFPCRQLEKLPAGLGIMADDWAAAAWTAGCLAVARWQHWL